MSANQVIAAAIPANQPPAQPAPAVVVDETPFWTARDQMSLSDQARLRVAEEGLEHIRDFMDFKESELSQAFKNIRINIPPIAGTAQVDNPDGTVLFAAIAPIPAKQGVILPAKCIVRLKTASKAYHFYKSIERVPTSVSMNFSVTLKEFNIEFEALIKQSKETKPEVPKITKNVTPLRWVESFMDCLFRTFGIRDCPLLYVVRKDADVPSELDDPLLPDKAYGESGSVIDEMIKRLTHIDPLYKSDNASVYSMLEEATRATVYAPTVKPYEGKRMVELHILR